jgi:hypothetical protein
MVSYALPQHFLYLTPLPQKQGSLRPILGLVLVIGACGAQQLESLQQLLCSSTSIGSGVCFVVFITTLKVLDN